MTQKAKPSKPSSILRPEPNIVVVGANAGYIQTAHEFPCSGGCGTAMVVWAAMRKESAEKFATCDACYKQRGLEKWREEAKRRISRAKASIQTAIKAANLAAAEQAEAKK